MKQGLNFALRVNLKGIDVDSIERIEFIFRKMPTPTAVMVKKAEYPLDVTYEDERFVIHWSAAETYKLKSGEKFFMDTRVTLKDSADQPETNIVALIMNPTLFEEE